MQNESRNERQTRARQWAMDTFGAAAATSPKERIRRFTEEAIELAQADGLSKEEVLELVSYVYSRPAGEPAQEVGGVGLTLLIYCEQAGMSADDLEQREFNRVLSKTREHFRARQDAKAAAGIATLSSDAVPG